MAKNTLIISSATPVNTVGPYSVVEDGNPGNVLASGITAFPFQGVIDNAATNGTFNVVIVDANGVSSDPVGPVTVQDCDNLAADFGFTKEAVYDSAAGQITYTFTVTADATNAGDISNILINDAAIGVVDLAVAPDPLAPGASAIATAIYSPTQAEIDAGCFSNVADLTAQNANGDPITARSTPPAGSASPAPGSTITSLVEETTALNPMAISPCHLDGASELSQWTNSVASTSANRTVLAIGADGKIYGSGNNNSGQLGWMTGYETLHPEFQSYDEVHDGNYVPALHWHIHNPNDVFVKLETSFVMNNDWVQAAITDDGRLFVSAGGEPGDDGNGNYMPITGRTGSYDAYTSQTPNEIASPDGSPWSEIVMTRRTIGTAKSGVIFACTTAGNWYSWGREREGIGYMAHNTNNASGQTSVSVSTPTPVVLSPAPRCDGSGNNIHITTEQQLGWATAYIADNGDPYITTPLSLANNQVTGGVTGPLPESLITMPAGVKAVQFASCAASNNRWLAILGDDGNVYFVSGGRQNNPAQPTAFGTSGATGLTARLLPKDPQVGFITKIVMSNQHLSVLDDAGSIWSASSTANTPQVIGTSNVGVPVTRAEQNIGFVDYWLSNGEDYAYARRADGTMWRSFGENVDLANFENAGYTPLDPAGANGAGWYPACPTLTPLTP